ncbi:hypothetical protein [Oligella urethralis]|uniref:DUF3592 domain-containing protein n=1 Tax=Oligella urethralis TaxID=90245 RepID=A0A2X1WEL5_9BURK|nr:hypothetical protein [Oligella urethralis]SPY07104.1 Uncharacterised protein [Oligella urethralis]
MSSEVMEYIVGILVFILNRWWLALLMIAVPHILIAYFTGTWGGKSTLLDLVTVCWLVATLLPGYALAPVINHYGRIAVAEIVSSETTMSRNEDFTAVYSVKAVYQDEKGDTQKVSYWDIKSRIYPVFSDYTIPWSKGTVFILKYLPSMPSEFIFLAELTEEERQAVCPVLKGKLSDYQAQKSSLGSERDVLNSKVYQGLTAEESGKLSRKMRRGEGLTADEKRLMVLNEKLLVLNRNMYSIQNDLIQGDRFCRE